MGVYCIAILARCSQLLLLVGLPVKIVSPAKMAKPIKMPFGIWTRVHASKHVLDGGAHCQHLASMTEPSMCGDDAASCQITLTTCYLYAVAI